MLAVRRVSEYLGRIYSGNWLRLFISTGLLYTFLSFPCTANNDLLYQVRGYHLSVLTGSDVYTLVNSPLPDRVAADTKSVTKALRLAGIKDSDYLAENVAEQTSEVIQLRWKNNKSKAGLLTVCTNPGQFVLKRWSDHPGSQNSESDVCDEHVLDSEQGEMLIARSLLQDGHSQLHFRRLEISIALNGADDGTLPSPSLTMPVVTADKPDVFTLAVYHYTENRAASGGSDLPRQSEPASTRVNSSGITSVDPDNPPDDDHRPPPAFPVFYFEKLGVLTVNSGNKQDGLLVDSNAYSEGSEGSEGNVMVLFLLADGSVQSVTLNKTFYQVIQASHHSTAFWSQLLQGHLSQAAATGFIANALNDLYQPFVSEGQEASASVWGSLSRIVDVFLSVPVHIDQGSPESLLKTGYSDYRQYLRQAGGGSSGSTTATTGSTTTITTTTAATTTATTTAVTTTSNSPRVTSGEPPRRPPQDREAPDGAAADPITPVQELLPDDDHTWCAALRETHPSFASMLDIDTFIPAITAQHMLTDNEIYNLRNPVISPLVRINQMIEWFPRKGEQWWLKVLIALYNSGHYFLAETFKQKAINYHEKHRRRWK